ncbi:hypothetical protein K2V14_003770 [Vibrio vulnificus]|nr:hypothetical protein [Vibrio vulnificus]EHY1122777.1 hypothetical protein [Vibrio vulnificus]
MYKYSALTLGAFLFALSMNAVASTMVCINESDFPYSNNVKIVTIDPESENIAVKAEINKKMVTRNYKLTKTSVLDDDGKYVWFYGHDGRSEHLTLIKEPSGSTLMFANVFNKDGLDLLTSVRRFEGLACH